MNITPQTQLALEELLERFAALEQKTSVERVAPPGCLVVVRADGIKHSKRFLKGDLKSPAYHNALHAAIGKTHRLWRNWTGPDSSPYLLGALRLSDEVSFILNRGPNYYHRRLLKMTTTLASSLSGAMTLAYLETWEMTGASGERPGSRTPEPPILAFDGRALVLRSSNDLEDYIRLRRLLHGRNAMARVLRLKFEMSSAQLYDQEPKIASDLFLLSQELESRGLWSDYEDAAAGAGLYLDAGHEGLRGINLSSDPTDEAQVNQALEFIG